MKLFNKNQLKYEDGYLTCGDEVYNLDLQTKEELVRYGELVQWIEWKKQQDVADSVIEGAMKTKCEFKPAETEKLGMEREAPETPYIDEQVQHALNLMKDYDKQEAHERYERLLSCFQNLLFWVKRDKVLLMSRGLREVYYCSPLGLTYQGVLDDLQTAAELGL